MTLGFLKEKRDRLCGRKRQSTRKLNRVMSPLAPKLPHLSHYLEDFGCFFNKWNEPNLELMFLGYALICSRYMLLREIVIIGKLWDRIFVGRWKWFWESIRARNIWGKAGMSKIYTYFGFKNGKLISVLQSLNGDAKKAWDCNYYVREPQKVEKQIENWKKEKSE